MGGVPSAGNALGLHMLTDLSSQLKTVDHKFALAVRRNLRNGIKQQGASVLGAVKAAASWSSRIPDATALSIRYNVNGASVRIQVNHNQAPHARPLELGNTNSYDAGVVALAGGFKTVTVTDRKTGQKRVRTILASPSVRAGVRKTGIGVSRGLRHPVFHKTSEPGGYATMPTRPFFFPVIEESKPGIDQAMERVVIQTAHDAGFR